MDEQSGERLATAISALIARFKVGPEGTSYEDLSLTDAAVISWLAKAAIEGDEPIQKDVGDALGLPKTTVTSAVKRLSARGLVAQGPGRRDGRARTLRLTLDGQHLGTALKAAQVRASEAILESLSARDQGRLITLLERGAATAPPPPPSLACSGAGPT